MRGTFANVRLRNLLAPGTEGGVTPPPARRRADDHLRGRRALRRRRRAPGRARRQGVRLGLVPRLGGQRHGAAGVRAVIAESYERIHRSNLIGMGVLPLQFAEGQHAASLGLTGHEVF